MRTTLSSIHWEEWSHPLLVLHSWHWGRTVAEAHWSPPPIRFQLRQSEIDAWEFTGVSVNQESHWASSYKVYPQRNSCHFFKKLLGSGQLHSRICYFCLTCKACWLFFTLLGIKSKLIYPQMGTSNQSQGLHESCIQFQQKLSSRLIAAFYTKVYLATVTSSWCYSGTWPWPLYFGSLTVTLMERRSTGIYQFHYTYLIYNFWCVVL